MRLNSELAELARALAEKWELASLLLVVSVLGDSWKSVESLVWFSLVRFCSVRGRIEDRLFGLLKLVRFKPCEHKREPKRSHLKDHFALVFFFTFASTLVLVLYKKRKLRKVVSVTSGNRPILDLRQLWVSRTQTKARNPLRRKVRDHFKSCLLLHPSQFACSNPNEPHQKGSTALSGTSRRNRSPERPTSCMRALTIPSIWPYLNHKRRRARVRSLVSMFGAPNWTEPSEFRRSRRMVRTNTKKWTSTSLLAFKSEPKSKVPPAKAGPKVDQSRARGRVDPAWSNIYSITSNAVLLADSLGNFGAVWLINYACTSLCALYFPCRSSSLYRCSLLLYLAIAGHGLKLQLKQHYSAASSAHYRPWTTGEKECFWDKMRWDESHNTHSSSTSKSYAQFSPVLWRPFREDQLEEAWLWPAFKSSKLRENQSFESFFFRLLSSLQWITEQPCNYNDPSITAKPTNSFLVSPFDCLSLPCFHT